MEQTNKQFSLQPFSPLHTLPPQPAKHTSSVRTFALADQWLRECRKNHDQCWQSIPWVPSRLIHLSFLDNGSLSALLRQLSNHDYENDVRYMTLSHRWLLEDAGKLTAANLAAYTARIPLEKQKASIRDAMDISLRLGIQYIWIDSLCIIQDESEDKAREISQMNLVFSHSTCTIAAECAAGFDDGCYVDRAEELIADYLIDLELSQSSMIPRCHRLRMEWDDHWSTNVPHSVLEGRAWIYQEMILSPRILHYGKERVSWVCRTMEASETSPVGRPLHRLKNEYSTIEAARLYDRSAVFHGMWDRIVYRYSSKQLTFAEDRLAGLQGIAQLCLESRGDEYFFGHWASRLPQTLCWQAKKAGGSRLAYVPSWSWASAEGPVWTDMRDSSSVVTLASASVRSVDPGLAPDLAPRSPTQPNKPSWMLQIRGRPLHATILARSCVFEREDNTLVVSTPSGPITIVPDCGAEWASHDISVTLLPLCGHQLSDGLSWIHGLVLMSGGKDSGGLTYRRIGMFSAEDVLMNADGAIVHAMKRTMAWIFTTSIRERLRNFERLAECDLIVC